mmetsp:Transcript_59256/g.136808  ORF Transcript_59256/g.136808 Transcript_59256/m.136808 type:complete len:194 (+) Transcript_59256:679-1260(+)
MVETEPACRLATTTARAALPADAFSARDLAALAMALQRCNISIGAKPAGSLPWASESDLWQALAQQSLVCGPWNVREVVRLARGLGPYIPHAVWNGHWRLIKDGLRNPDTSAGRELRHGSLGGWWTAQALRIAGACGSGTALEASPLKKTAAVLSARMLRSQASGRRFTWKSTSRLSLEQKLRAKWCSLIHTN